MANGSQYTGSFVPTTNVWDPSQVIQIEDISPELKEVLVRLYQNLNTMALAVNIRDAGYYVQQEFLNGQAWFANPNLTSASKTTPAPRQVVRKVFNFGTLPDNTVKKLEHGIPVNGAYSFTRIYGCASDPVNLKYVPLPYASGAQINAAPNNNLNIELWVDGTYINVQTNTAWDNYTICYIVLEYILS